MKLPTLNEVKKENSRSIETHIKVYKLHLERLEQKIKQFNAADKADTDDFYHENFAFELDQITDALSHTAKSLSGEKRVRQALDDISD